MVDKFLVLCLRRDLREARKKVIWVQGRVCMAEGMVSTEAKGSLKGINETVVRTLESQEHI